MQQSWGTLLWRWSLLLSLSVLLCGSLIMLHLAMYRYMLVATGNYPTLSATVLNANWEKSYGEFSYCRLQLRYQLKESDTLQESVLDDHSAHRCQVGSTIEISIDPAHPQAPFRSSLQELLFTGFLALLGDSLLLFFSMRSLLRFREHQSSQLTTR